MTRDAIMAVQVPLLIVVLLIVLGKLSKEINSWRWW